MKCLPYFVKGIVVKGFGRGSKDLGCPTANLPSEVVENLPEDLFTGVYYGWGSVEGDNVVRKIVMSIGWNPYFKNEKKSLEVHVLHKYDSDFYGKEMKIAILGYIRPEKDFSSVDELIKAIQNDITTAKESLNGLEHFQSHNFFKQNVL